MEPVAPKHVRYIKLGPGGRWANEAFEQGELPVGYPTVPHEPCQAGDWDQVSRCLIETDGLSPGKARDGARGIRDFYTVGADCLWVTFAHSRLWRAFAEPEVRYLSPETEGGHNRTRRTVDGWHKTDIRGKPLRAAWPSSRVGAGGISCRRQALARPTSEIPNSLASWVTGFPHTRS